MQDLRDSAVLYISTLSQPNFYQPNFYRSIEGGSWQAQTAGLPGVNLNALSAYGGETPALLAATEGGLFLGRELMWSAYLPLVMR